MAEEEGEAAFSTGPMVPVLASNDEGRSRAALALLEAHGIPALLDADVRGAFVGFHDPVPDGWNQVLVPNSMRAEALEVLRRNEAEAASRRPRPASAFELPRPSGRPPRGQMPSLPLRSTEDGFLALQRGVDGRTPGLAPGDVDDLEPERFEPRLPPPSALQPRVTLALLAIALGGALQRGLNAWLGPEVVFAHLAARAPVTEEIYRLVTASFLHGSASHFLSNAAFGLVFGVVLFGTHRVGATALTWLLASACGMAAEVSLGSVAVIGASAGNYGLVGLWTHGQLERARVAILPRRERLKTLGVLLLLVPGALTPFSSTGSKIAILAHVFGFLAGYALGRPFRRRLLPEGFERIEQRSQLAGIAALVIGAVGWLLGLASFLGPTR